MNLKTSILAGLSLALQVSNAVADNPAFRGAATPASSNAGLFGDNLGGCHGKVRCGGSSDSDAISPGAQAGIAAAVIAVLVTIAGCVYCRCNQSSTDEAREALNQDASTTPGYGAAAAAA